MITKTEDRSHSGPCNAPGAECTVPAEFDVKAFPAPVRLWLTPIRDQLPVIAATMDKPLAELTMPEVMAWGLVGAYCVLSGILAGQLAANVAVTVLRGPYRR